MSYKKYNKYIDLVQQKRRGRPSLIINEDGKNMIETLAGLSCTDEEIADALGTTCDTLHNENNDAVFSECKKRGFSTGKISLRRAQRRLAEKSAAMAIFLGKNILGQRDYPENNTDDVVERANAQILALADLINNPVENLTIEELENERRQEEGEAND